MMIRTMIVPFYFFVSFAIGLFFVYIMAPAPTVIMKFPSPYNAGKVVYKDKSDSCYVYRADKAECPLDKTRIKSQPLFEDYVNRIRQ